MRYESRCIVLGLAASLLSIASSVRAQTDFDTTEIANGVYQFRWQAHNALFITTPAGVVAVDPIGVEAARQLARRLAQPPLGAKPELVSVRR